MNIATMILVGMIVAAFLRALDPGPVQAADEDAPATKPADKGAPAPEQLPFEDDGTFPNNALPLLVYRQALSADTEDLATAFERRFAANDWKGSWRNGVYRFPHYHSTTHEVLAIYRGTATLQLGGSKSGATVKVRAGDVIVIPAGVAHQNLEASDDFGVVGAYPGGRRWDLLRGLPGERPKADRSIANVPLPDNDPLYGTDGPLRRIWNGSDSGTK